MATYAVSGAGPVVFFTESGQQVTVPLTALSFVDGQLEIDAAYQGVAGLKPWLDYLQQAGRLQQAAAPPASLAMVVAAARPGTDGNDVQLTIAFPDPSDAEHFDVTVTELEILEQLSPEQLEEVLGTADEPGSRPGLVRVVAAAGYQLPKAMAETPLAGGSGTNPSSLEIKAADDSTAFVLQARAAGADGDLTQVEITDVDDVEGTFKLTATWTKKVEGLTAAGAAAADLGYAVQIAAPAGQQIATPEPGTYALTGGAEATTANRSIVARS
ncbi:MAG: hypothetical protein FJ125_02960 [Deltaproteobacteria bacterium]|nr:hypothetical protein [Deltaproteobacteria bacterium]